MIPYNYNVQVAWEKLGEFYRGRNMPLAWHLQLTEGRDVMRIALAQVPRELRLKPEDTMTITQRMDSAVLDYVLRTLNAQAREHVGNVTSGVENPEPFKFQWWKQ